MTRPPWLTWVATLGCCLPLSASAALPPALDLHGFVHAFVERLPGRGSEALHLPSPDDVSALTGALRLLQASDVHSARRLVEPLGYRVDVVRDTRDGRVLALLTEASFDRDTYRGWGLYAVPLGPASRLAVEVTHPASDVHTGAIGVEAFRHGQGSLLSIAGTHRYANGDGSSDTAHEGRTMLARVNRVMTRRATVVLQPHGFSRSNFPEYGDIVVSSGDAPPSDAVISVADELSEEFDTCLYDGTSCTGLAATTNVEGAQAKRVGATFVHLELVREIRDDEDLRREAIQSAVGALLAED